MLGIVLFVLFAGCAEASDVDIAIVPPTYDLGQVGHDDRILGAAEIANRSHKPVTIRSVRSNCGCYKVSCPPRDLLPGESATVEFDLTFPRGKELHNPVIYVLTDDKEKPMRTLQMKMSLTEEPLASQAEEDELVVELRGEQSAANGSLEALGQRLGIVPVEEHSYEGVKRVAIRLRSGAEVEEAAKAYARHPNVSLVFLRAGEAAEGPAEIAKPAEPTRGEQLAVSAATVRKRLAPLAVLWFYSEGCAFCEDTKRLLKEVSQKYERNVAVSRHEISSLENYEKLIVLEEKFGVKGNDPMVLFVGDTFLSGHRDILAKLDVIVADQLAKGAPNLAASFLSPGGLGSGELVRRRFSSFSILAVVLAGLLDGVNPCAFTTLVFFVSFLTYTGKKKQILSVGLTFSAAVFVAYLLIGLGLFRALFLLSAYRVFSDVLFYAILTMLMAFAALSVYDCVVFSVTEKSERIVLQLPRSFKRRIHDAIRKHDSGKSLILGAVVSGFVVSVFESVCTGQVYLPTIAFVLKNPDLRPQAVLYLVLYNLMFIVPLIAVFVMAFFGVTSESLGRFLKKRVALSKAALACFVAGLAVLLIRTR